MKLSIIVPVYNVEKFLPRCLDSLLRQGLESGEYEVICVNDGSLDNSASILQEYEVKHSDIFKVITQENMGLGEARNTGMRAAQGEWIGFVDSDDYVVDGGYQYILEQFCEEYVDVVNYNCVLAYTDGQSLYDAEAKPYGEISFDGDGTEAYNQFPLPYVWSKLYRRSLLEKSDIFFESSFMEDEPFNFKVFRKSPHLRIVTSNIYRYEQGNVNSLLSVVEKEKVKDQLRIILPIIGKMNYYIQTDGGKMAPAAKRIVNLYLRTYYNKLLKARLTKREWKEYTLLLKQYPIHKINVTGDSSYLGKIIACLKNMTATSYTAYFMVEFLFRVFFTNIIRPHIIASYSK